MKRIYNKYKSGKGFTLLEMLIVVAILVILMGITIVSLVSLRKNLRQKQLDYCAELIYMAAQNQLAELSVTPENYAEKYGRTRSDVIELGYKPSDTEQFDVNGSLYPTIDSICYTVSWSGDDAAGANTAHYIVPESKISAEIWNGDWVIEYAPDEAFVYAVYYSEKSADGSDSRVRAYSNTDKEGGAFEYFLRYKEYRLTDGAQVGYYGGDTVVNYEYQLMQPHITVYNEEALVACISCVSLDKQAVTYEMTVSDGTTTMDVSSNRLISVQNGGNLWVATVILDSLDGTGANRFCNLFPTLTPGADLTLTVTAKSQNKFIDNSTVTQNTLTQSSTESTEGEAVVTQESDHLPINSLYDSVDADGTVVIRCARHLQNLDNDAYGVKTQSVTKARQIADISFVSDDSEDLDWYQEDWDTCYDGRSFDPIRCDSLTEYDGDNDGVNFEIIGLHTKSGLDKAGLFESAGTSLTISNLTLSGTVLNKAGNAGALVARIGQSGTSTVTIKNCQVNLNVQRDIEDLDTGTDWPTQTWITGSYAGGLVGRMDKGTLNITNSMASTVINGTVAAGGLIGYCNSGNVNVSGSYAGGYTKGNYAGALIGRNISGIVKLENSYAAGYLQPGKFGAGLVYGKIYSASAVYTAVWLQTEKDSKITYYSTATSAEKPETPMDRVYYLQGSTSSESNLSGTSYVDYEKLTGSKPVEGTKYLTDLLGSSFVETPRYTTVAYNLLGQSLGQYPYPSFSTVAHYGDWYAEFESGSLVYYEQYKDKTYGFYGANVNTLVNNQLVIGDGYGLVYYCPTSDSSTPKASANLYVSCGDTTVQLTDANGAPENGEFLREGDYVILPFPTSITNNDDAAVTFWQQLKITEGGENGVATYYYFNPHFARLAESALEGANNTLTAPDLPDTVYIRSARQLYNLSLYYDNYKNSNHSYSFDQSLDISYSDYNWTDYAAVPITSQKAIGWNESTSTYVDFSDEYDGNSHFIYGLSLETGSYAGLFASNTGTLKNIVLANDLAKELTLTLNESNHGDSSLYAGVLAAYNKGSISNCAVAGYYVKVSSSVNGTGKSSAVYVGGLVGYNDGTIQNSSAECPTMELVSIKNSNIRMGGFVGGNGGVISGCYALTALTQTDNSNTTGRTTVLAGFCAKNGPKVINCYCASSFRVTGSATQYAFAPTAVAGNTLQNCYYLHGGTFHFAGRTYTYENATGGGTAIGYTDLGKLSMNGFTAAKNNYVHAYTTERDSESTAYPFPTSVKDNSATAAHYGDWVASVTTNDGGVFYWEKEVDENNGIHYYISFVDDNTNLCTTHDDGGIITEFGYGIFAKVGATVSVTSVSGLPAVASLTTNTTAKTALESLMPGYTFTPFTTGTGDGQLYLTEQSETTTKIGSVVNYLARNGAVSMTVTKGTKTVTETYYVCPFFGDAFSTQSLIKEDGDLLPGNNSNPYLIRNVDQLQYINWNYTTRNCKTDVTPKTDDTAETYKSYPFLQYATVTSQGTQTQSAAEAVRPVQYWKQTHDLESTTKVTSDTVGNKEAGFWPIAGTSTGSQDRYLSLGTLDYLNGNFDAVLYAWFGGSYDGQSYKIVNLGISSYLNNIGVFGYTCGAELKNIIMYSDNDSVIKRVPNVDAGMQTLHVGGIIIDSLYMKYYENGNDSYAIGGLVGIAYEYSNHTARTISNCAIAGYSIEDRSKNQRISCGDVNIGGLFGICNANILNCSSVVDITVDSTFEYFACLGNTVRAGGIAGCCNYELSNCYAGGSISLGQNARNAINGTSGCTRAQKHYGINVAGVGTSGGDFYFTHYCFSGICAGNFGGNFMNFTNSGDVDTDDHILTINNFRDFYDTKITQSFNNCYSYVTITEAEGGSNSHMYDDDGNNVSSSWSKEGTIAVSSVMAIGGIPELLNDDSAWWNGVYAYTEGGVTIDNCWYLENSVIEPTDYDAASTGITWENYALGMRRLSNDQSKTDTVKNSGSMDLLSMSDGTLQSKLADAGFEPVTTYEDSGTKYVGGKYSFPGNDKTLLGTIYPFPTIITQTNAYGETAHVHYGQWPNGLLMFEEYYVNLDLLSDNREVTLRLTTQGDMSSQAPTLSFLDELGNRSELVETYKVRQDGSDWIYTFSPKGTGTIQITATGVTRSTQSTITAQCQVTVTGDFTLEATPIDNLGNTVGSYGYVNTISTVKYTAGYVNSKSETVDILQNTNKLRWTVELPENEVVIFADGYNSEAPVQTLSDGRMVTGFKLDGQGSAIVVVKLEYALDGWDSDGPVLEEEVSIPWEVWSTTVVGLANLENSTQPLYTEITNSVDAPNTYKREDLTSNRSAVPESSDSSLYLYYRITRPGELEIEKSEFVNLVKSGTWTVNGSDGQTVYTLNESGTWTANGSASSTNHTLVQPDTDTIIQSGNYLLLPIEFNSTAGDWKLTFEGKTDAAYISEGTKSTQAVTWTLPIAVNRDTASQLTVTFLGHLSGEGLEEETRELKTKLVYYKEAASADGVEFPQYTTVATDAVWKNYVSGGPNLGDALTKDTAYIIELTAKPYTFVFHYEENSVTKNYVYGRDDVLDSFEDMFTTLASGVTLEGWTLHDTEGHDVVISDMLFLIADAETLNYALQQLTTAESNGYVDMSSDIHLYARLYIESTSQGGTDAATEEPEEIVLTEDETGTETSTEITETAEEETFAETKPETETETEPEIEPEVTESDPSPAEETTEVPETTPELPEA